MITSLSIQNYALIDNLNIQLNKGLSIITGETGAGKSIILGAMALIMGQRADLSVIQNPDKKCVVEAIFNISEYKLQKIFQNSDIDYFDQTIIRREISPEGRSRAFVNDIPVNLSVLKDISKKLIDIHSQDDTLALNNSSFQIETIDLFAKNTSVLYNYQKAHKLYKNAISELNKLKEQAQIDKKNYDYLNYQFDQINNANLKENEQTQLEIEQKQLSHTEEIKQNISQINLLLNNDEKSIISMLKEANNISGNIINFLPKAKEISARIETAFIDLQDLSTETEIIENDLELNPDRLNFINNRLDTIYTLQQKFSIDSISGLLDLKGEIEKKLLHINSFDEQINQKQTEIDKLLKKLTEFSDKLSENRKKHKQNFEKKIEHLIQNLGMPNSHFIVDIQTLENFTSYGKDKISFLFSANKNFDAQAITKIASGGELSRLMLAIKYIISLSKTLPTIIFDEIDSGISGEIADKMGLLLRKMANNMQIINITHLPQIAAKGHSHFLVYKDNFSEKTTSNIKQLSDHERITEIAKMLSGANITDSSLQNAKELLSLQ